MGRAVKRILEDYPHEFGGHCATTAMRGILKMGGHDLSEEMLFGLGSAFSLVFMEAPGMNPPIHLIGRTAELEELVCNRIGVGINIVRGLDNRTAWQRVKEMIDAGIPAMVHCDVYDLDYLNAKRHFSGHRIVIVGYDEEEGVAFISDNDRDTIQKCSLESLERARCANFFPLPADNLIYEFDIPTSLRSLVEIIPSAIHHTVDQNLHVPPEREVLHFEGVTFTEGVLAADAFVESLRKWPSILDAKKLELACKIVFVSVEKGGTGHGGFFRRFFGRFLLESAVITEVSELEEIGEAYIRLGNMWTDIAHLFKDHSTEGVGAVEATLPLAEQIATMERDLLTGLEEIILIFEERGYDLSWYDRAEWEKQKKVFSPTP